MSRDWIATKESELVTQSAEFSAKISASPSTYGLVAADATALATDQNAYALSYGLSADPATGTRVWIVARWCNNRGEPGPVATPVSAVIISAVAEAA